jgi:hypothetical protein
MVLITISDSVNNKIVSTDISILFCLISLILCQGGYAGKTQREPCFNCGSYKFEYEQGGADIIVKGWLKASIQFVIDIGAK